MYSMVMLVAMSTSPDTVACHRGGCCVASSYSCYGGGYRGCYGGGYGGCYGGGYGGCYGGGYGGCYGGCYGYAPTVGGPVYAAVPAYATPQLPRKAPAYITVNVPEDAKVTIGSVATSASSATRVFSSPELPYGSVYYYTITAEVVRNGQTFTATEKVAVEAGVNSKVTLHPNVGPVVASK